MAESSLIKTTAQERRDTVTHAQQMLRRYVEDGDTIYTLTETGRGESRYVRVFAVDDGSIEELTFYAARAYGDHSSLERGWRLRGHGYNAGLEAVQRLAYGMEQGGAGRVLVDAHDDGSADLVIGWAEL